MAKRFGRNPYRPPPRVLQPEDVGYEPLEKHIAGEIIQALRMIGCHVSSTQQTRASRQTIGMPDLWVVHPAFRWFGWIEVKRPGEKATKAQIAWHEATRAAGCPVLVATGAADAINQINQLRLAERESRGKKSPDL